jgi:hypothetical protein
MIVARRAWWYILCHVGREYVCVSLCVSVAKRKRALIENQQNKYLRKSASVCGKKESQ